MQNIGIVTILKFYRKKLIEINHPLLQRSRHNTSGLEAQTQSYDADNIKIQEDSADLTLNADLNLANELESSKHPYKANFSYEVPEKSIRKLKNNTRSRESYKGSDVIKSIYRRESSSIFPGIDNSFEKSMKSCHFDNNLNTSNKKNVGYYS